MNRFPIDFGVFVLWFATGYSSGQAIFLGTPDAYFAKSVLSNPLFSFQGAFLGDKKGG